MVFRDKNELYKYIDGRDIEYCDEAHRNGQLKAFNNTGIIRRISDSETGEQLAAEKFLWEINDHRLIILKQNSANNGDEVENNYKMITCANCFIGAIRQSEEAIGFPFYIQATDETRNMILQYLTVWFAFHECPSYGDVKHGNESRIKKAIETIMERFN